MAESNNPTETEMLAMATAADEGKEYLPTEPNETKADKEVEVKASGDTEQTPATAETTEPKSLSDDKATEASKDESVKNDSSLTDQPSETKSDSASEKKPTRYEKAKSRLEKEWDDVREEKARLKAERESIEKSREAASSSRETEKSSSKRFSAEDYREASKAYRDEGRDDLAKLAEQKATEIETEDKQEFEKKTQAGLKDAWDQNLLKEVEANPELKDSKSSLYKAVAEMLQNHAILRNYPAGINDAVGIAKIKIKSESASDLEKKVVEYERELAQLRKATTPGSGQPSTPAKKKAFHQLSLDEQETELMKMASEADRN